MSTGISPLEIIFKLDVGAGTCFDMYCQPHLDSIIAWTLAPLQGGGAYLGRNERPIEFRLPLASRKIRGHNVWCASALFVMGGGEGIIEDFRSFRKKTETKGIEYAKGNINLKSGTFRDWNFKIQILHITHLVAYAYGNASRIRQLLKRVPGIGLKRHRGFGRIEGVEVNKTNNAWCFIRDGKAMRWLPDENGLRMVRTQPPYWNNIDKVRCCEVGDPYKL